MITRTPLWTVCEMNLCDRVAVSKVLTGRDLILEALSLVEERVLSRSIQAIVSNKTTAFLTRLDGGGFSPFPYLSQWLMQ